MKDRLRKFGATALLMLAVFTFSSAAILAPKTAYAVIPVSTDADAPRITEWILSALKYLGQTALVASVSTALINTVTYATDRLAYDAAVYIAAGGNGDDPLFDNRTAGDYFADYGASVAGEALGAIDDTGILGNFSLCEPNASGVTLAFKFGIQGVFDRPKPACEWSAVKDNWGGFISDVSTMASDPFGKNSLITTKLADMYNPKSNDLSVGIQLYSDVLNKAQTDAANSTLREMFGGFFKDKTNFITGKVETPAELIQKRLDATMMASDSIRNQIAVQALGDKEVLLQIAKHAGSVFTNTLLSKVTEKLYDGLFSGLDQTAIDPFNVEGVGSSNAEDARESFRSFLTATPLSVENYSQLEEFSACPTAGKSLYNCVADSSFVTAVSRADSGSSLTIAEAIEEGLLNSSWPLIPSSDTARDQDPFCYTYGYCHGNLVKLRKARIISTSWEIAAESNANSENSPVTLGEVVDAFNDCSDQGELDDNHPWCHLIDPNWVLKYPETQCKALVYGEQLVASVTDERMDVCVDMPSCIDEDGDGNCTGGYGYCVREENVWRFRGEECPDYYASCTTYEDPNGDNFDYLSNTTNSDNCTADSAGCLWYATQKVDDGTGTFDFPDYTADAAPAFATAEAANDMYKNRIYFTSEVADCQASDAGCRELVSRAGGTTLNMVANSSFEDDADNDGVPDGWIISGTGMTYSIDASVKLGGVAAVNPVSTSSAYIQPGIVLTQGAEYTYSLYARQGTGTGAATDGWLSLASNDGTTIDLTGYALSGDCALGFSNATIAITETPTDTDYQRYTCTFTVPALADTSAEITGTIFLTGGDVWYDQIQLEQESSASSYHEGYSGSVLDLAYVKVAPSYLGCTGDSATDPADCANYATVCSESDVGCSLYTPSNGDPSVAGITDSLDSCPESCVGYDTFKQEATRYEPDGDFPVYFIPDSADECSAQAVGCDEFTDISSEAPSYFTNLRACLTTAQADLNTIATDGAEVFYTWEGSDTAGYQIKTWNLLESDIDPVYAPMTYADSGETDDAPQSAPCTNWSATATGIACNDDETTAGKLETDSASCDQHDDTITNPDCREFYDASGIIHYRLWSKTVTVNNSCVTYRKTDLVGFGDDNDANGVDDGKTNCQESGGFFDSATSECRYYGYADESATCSEKESGCREYTGGRSRNSRQAFTEYFENGDLTNWDAASASDVTLSNESIATDGHSLSSDGESVWTYVGGSSTACAEATTGEGCASTTGALGGSCTIVNGEYSCGTLSQELFADKTYTISFWAKGTGMVSVGFGTVVSGAGVIGTAFESSIDLATDWNEYTYGPLDMNGTDHPNFGDGSTALVFTPGSGSDTFFIDNVVLREGEDNIDVIKDSWVTPAECDETVEGTSSPQYMLGCQEYTDQNGDVSDLKSFSSLCEESQVGCSSYFMTQESDATTAAVYGGSCSTIDGEPALSATSCYYALNSALTAYDTSSQFLCTIGVGSTSCEFNLDWYLPPSTFTASGSRSPHLSYAASTVVSPADKDVFLVVNSNVECTSDVAGCMEVGLPVFSQDHTAVASWTATYLMNTPADYAATLCSEKELYCDAFTDKNSSVHYFKTPQDQTCEYRTDVTIDNVTYSGWFKTGEDELCATDADGNPQYVIGGDTSGIWKNGDDDYNNWVGTCLTKYDSCSEFQDLTDLSTDQVYGDADGTSYYYLNNDSLEDNSLPDSQKCNGQVSQKEGCGLFNDTSEPSKTYNMSASYVASKHADTLFGGAPNGMADPIDCSNTSTILTPSGDTVDLCANRCWYDADAYYDINGATGDAYIFDGSCYEDSDCRPLTSESGETVNGFCASRYGTTTTTRLENDANMVLKVNRDRECSEWLSCSDAQTTWDERTNSYKTICGDIGLCTEYSTSGNASFCSAWKVDDAAVVLDADTYSQRDVSWYGDDYSGYAIPGSLPVDQLTQKNVAAPSGTCNTGPGDSYNGLECTDDEQCGGTAGEYALCPNADDSDYRLAFIAGSCDLAYGENCSIGYCENTGSPCAASDSCGVTGGSCLIGTCYAVSTTLCASSADCSTGEACLGGYCATAGSGAAIDDYNGKDSSVCALDETLYTSVNYKVGTCMRDECVLTPTGGTFDTGTAEAKSCRGYPEINSPFPTSVVSTWKDVNDSDADNPTYSSMPETYVQNFDNAKTCIEGEDCSCSYKKVTYGGTLKYFGSDTMFPFDNGAIGVCNGGTFDGNFCSSSSTYYYDSGSSDWRYAIINADSTCADGGGTCDYPTKTDDVLGMDGYCLERDTSTNILGDRDLNACVTWLPVDQLQGSTDLYAKYIGAGYTGDTYYCDDPKLYENVYTSHIADELTTSDASDEDNPTKFSIACVEISNGSGTAADDLAAATTPKDPRVSDLCLHQDVYCPVGYYAVIGAPMSDWNNADGIEESDGLGTYADACNQGEPSCPLICVPEGATTSDSSGVCTPPTNYDKTTTNPLTVYVSDLQSSGSDSTEIRSTTDLYYIADYDTFAEEIALRKGCVSVGREVYRFEYPNIPTSASSSGPAYWSDMTGSMLGTSEAVYTGYEFPQDSLRIADGFLDNKGFYNLDFAEPRYYLGCGEAVKTATSDLNGDIGAPWTDRLLNENSIMTLRPDVSKADTSGYVPDENKFTYTLDGVDTLPVPLGAMKSIENDYYGDARPTSFAQCEADSGTGLSSFVIPEIDSATGEAVCSESGYSTSNLSTVVSSYDSDPESRLYYDVSGYVDWANGATSGSFSFFGVDSSSAGRVADGITENIHDGLLEEVFATRLDWSKYDDGVFDTTSTYGGSLSLREAPTSGAYMSDAQSNDNNTSAGWDIRAENGKPPSVWAVDVDNCYNDECEEDQTHGLTMNDQNEGDVSSESFYRAYLKFFAAADKNQLPLRRVIIDWGDDSGAKGSETGDNFYKNHRGLEDGKETSICEKPVTDSDYAWGMNTDSCDPNYFSYSHIYTCDTTEVITVCADTDGDGIYDNTPCTQDGGESCTFRPRVQVLDNWGFCSGTCDSTIATTNDDGTASCFNSGSSWGSTEDSNECDYTNYPGGDYTGATDPWVYYDGTITVTP
ncbi:MAG: hypothetical protein AAB473_04935 [Patescibacteria group bacterium]